MKTDVASIIAAALILLVSFQNCQKPPYPDEINDLHSSQIFPAGKVDLSKETIVSINFFIPATENVIKAGNSYQINYNKSLLVDAKSGIIIETSDLTDQTAQFCLTDSLKDELNNILSSSQVCSNSKTVPEGTVCTQVMKMAYAQLITSRTQFELGSASDGCGRNSLDLCGDQAGILKAFIEALKRQYLNMPCRN